EEDLEKEFINYNKSIKLINKSTHIIGISDSIVNKYKKNLKPSLISKIYNGVDSKQYVVENKSLFNKRNIIITIAGRITETKGHKTLIYAFKQLVDRGMVNLKLQIVGNKSDPVFAKKIKLLVDECQLRNRV